MTDSTPHDQGPINPAWLIVVIGFIVAGVWIWKRLSLETQDYIVDQAVPMAAMGIVSALLLFIPFSALRRRRAKSKERTRLLALFDQATAQEKDWTLRLPY